MDVEHVGAAVLHMANLPLETNVQFMTIMATRCRSLVADDARPWC